MRGRIIALKGVHVLMPRTCKYVILHYKGNIADVIKLRIFRRGYYHRSSGWAHYNNKSPHILKKRQRVRIKERTEDATLLPLKKGPQAHQCQWFLEAGKEEGKTPKISRRKINT